MSGAIIMEPREVHGFKAVLLKGTGDLIIQQADEEELVLEAEESMLPHILTEVRNEVLVIEYRNPVELEFVRRPFIYHLKMVEIHGVEISGAGTLESESIHTTNLQLGVSGSGKMEIDDLQCEHLTVTISGSAKLEITGSVARQEIVVSGTGHVQAWGLTSRDALVRVSGSAGVMLRASATLDVNITGMGTVEYYGSPRIKRKITGIGSLQNLGED